MQPSLQLLISTTEAGGWKFGWGEMMGNEKANATLAHNDNRKFLLFRCDELSTSDRILTK